MTSRYYDLLVVGSGPVGSTYARLIADRVQDARILMVEAGPQLTGRPGMHVRNIVGRRARAAAQGLCGPPGPAADQAAADAAVAAISRALVRPGIFFADPRSAASLSPSTLALGAMASNVGGMGAHWSFACPDPVAGEIIPWIPDHEWRDALRAARTLLAVSTGAFPQTSHGEAILMGLGKVFPWLPPGRGPQPMPLACQLGADGTRYWTGPDVIMGDLVASPRFELRTRTLCRRLLHDGRAVRGAEIEDLASGERRQVTARAIIVTGDSLRTPQLLAASGIHPPALGRYLNDHIQIVTTVRLSDELLGQASRRRPDLPDARRSPDDMLAGVYWLPYSPEHPFHGQIMDYDPRARREGHVVGLSWFVPKEIRGVDRVYFPAEGTDSYGMPLIRTSYELTARDQASIETAKADIVRAAAALGDPEPDSPEPTVLPPGASLHYQGTVRMGPCDDGTSVCDAQSRVWGFTNLFVGGNGVIPTATAGNPTLTSVALAAHASRAVARLLSRSESHVTVQNTCSTSRGGPSRFRVPADRPVRVAVVGAGWAGGLHLEGFKRTVGTQLVGIHSRTRQAAEKLASRYEVAIVASSIAELIEQADPDLVTIATPPAVHLEQSLEVVSAGRHLLCDKPIAPTKQDAEQILEAAEQAGVLHASGFIWRGAPALRRLRQALRAGLIGEVLELRSACPLGIPLLPMTWMYDQSAGGGALAHHGSHVLDRAIWLVGAPISEVCGELHHDLKEAPDAGAFHSLAEAFAWSRRPRPRGLPTVPVTAETGYSFLARFVNGVRGQFWEGCHNAGAADEEITIVGTDGTLHWTARSGLCLIRIGAAIEQLDIEGETTGSGATLPREIAKRWAELAAAITEALRGGTTVFPDLRDGVNVAAASDALRRSHLSRRWEKVT